MKRHWTIQKALEYVTDVQKGKGRVGLAYCSAVDYLRKMEVEIPSIEPTMTEEEGEIENG